MTSKHRRLIIGVTGVLVVGVTALFLLQAERKNAFATAVEKCNRVVTEERFSCYRKALQDSYESASVANFVRYVQEDAGLSFAVGKGEVTYAIFGANCHTFYHALGDFVAMHADGDPKDLLYMGSTKCTGGYLMGLYKRMALEEGFAVELLKTFYGVSRLEERAQAAHEIGHLLHDKYTTALLSVVDGISRNKYNLRFPRDYQYTTFPDQRADLNAPFEKCDEIIPKEDPDMRRQCRTGIGHNMFVFSEFDPEGYKSQFAQCEETVKINREDCYAFLIYRIGINEGATKFLSYKFDEGNQICQELVQLAGSEDMMYHCYVGIGGGIGLFIDSEYPPGTITGENIVNVKQKLQSFMELCEMAEEKFVYRCYTGLFGTRFAELYDLLNLYNKKVEILRPNLQEFEVTG